MARSRRRERGQSIVELGLLCPVLVILLLVTLDFGRVFYAQIGVITAARVAAETAANYDSGISPVDAGLDELPGILANRQVTVSVVCTEDAGSEGTTTVGQASGDLSLITPGLSAIVGGTLQLRSQASARCF